ncbi:hypothetical protein [Kibdelosporangium philippinense]
MINVMSVPRHERAWLSPVREADGDSVPSEWVAISPDRGTVARLRKLW